MVGLAAESTAPVQVPVLGNSTLCTDNGGWLVTGTPVSRGCIFVHWKRECASLVEDGGRASQPRLTCAIVFIKVGTDCRDSNH